MRFAMLIAAVVLTISANGFVQAKESSCNVSAYVKDAGAAGLNVRAGAGTNFKVIGVIPFDADGTVVKITASSGKWFKISGAHNAGGESVFDKAGWVYAPSLAVTALDNGKQVSVFTSNSKKGGIISTLRGGDETLLEGCAGAWLKITVQGSARPFSGWLTPGSYCANPWNSCS